MHMGGDPAGKPDLLRRHPHVLRAPTTSRGARPERTGDLLQHTVSYGSDGRGIRVTRTESLSNSANTAARRYYFYNPELRLVGDPSPYAYALGNPITNADPLGLKVFRCCGDIQVNASSTASHRCSATSTASSKRTAWKRA